MPAVLGFLDRFRPAGAPGRASLAAVPGDPAAGLESELEPVLAALSETIRACERLRTAAATATAQQWAGTTERAEAIVSHAHHAYQAQRREIAAQLRAHAQADTAAFATSAAVRAATIRATADQERAALVARVIERARADLVATVEDTATERTTTGPGPPMPNESAR